MPYYNIPISQNLPQTFQRVISGRIVKVAIQYNDFNNNWFLYFSELVNDQENVLVSNLPLVTGVNILQQFPHKDLGESFIVYHREPDLEYDYPQAKTLNNKFIYIWEI